MGYLARQDAVYPTTLRRAMVRGATMASFTVEDFGLKRLLRVKDEEVAERFAVFERVTSFQRL